MQKNTEVTQSTFFKDPPNGSTFTLKFK